MEFYQISVDPDDVVVAEPMEEPLVSFLGLKADGSQARMLLRASLMTFPQPNLSSLVSAESKCLMVVSPLRTSVFTTRLSLSPCRNCLRVSNNRVFILEQTSLGANSMTSLTQRSKEIRSLTASFLPSSSGYFQKYRELPEMHHHNVH